MAKSKKFHSLFPIRLANTILSQLPRTCFAVLVLQNIDSFLKVAGTGRVIPAPPVAAVVRVHTLESILPREIRLDATWLKLKLTLQRMLLEHQELLDRLSWGELDTSHLNKRRVTSTSPPSPGTSTRSPSSSWRCVTNKCESLLWWY